MCPDSEARSGWHCASSRATGAALAGLLVCVLLAAIALLSPYMSLQDPLDVAPAIRLLPPGADHWFGTDSLGRDLFSRVLFGARVSLRVGFVAVGIALAGGLLLGMTSGFYGGTADLLISLLLDVMLAFPGLLLALLIVATLGVGLENSMLALGVAGIPTYARVGAQLNACGQAAVVCGRSAA